MNKDYKNALKYYKKAFDILSSNSDSKSTLVATYIARIYAKRNDYNNAIVWYSIPAERGDKELQYELAQLYEKVNNKNLAIFWYKKAAEQKHLKAEENLARYGVFIATQSQAKSSEISRNSTAKPSSTSKQSSREIVSYEISQPQLGPCPGCQGAGSVMCGGCNGTGTTYMGNPCVLCNSTGRQTCIVCGGTGQTMNYGSSNSGSHIHNHSVPNQGTTNSKTSFSGTSKTLKTCGLCNGKGWILETKGVASFGNEKWCDQCKKNVPANHYHATCPSCQGTGKN